MQQVPVESMDLHRFVSVVAPQEQQDLLELIADGARELAGRVIWNVNSTAKGGGVVELLRPLLGYSRGAGVDARWMVIKAEPDFFTITKRLHNRLHGFPGDGGPLDSAERAVYQKALAAAAAEFVPLVRPVDVIILHDPQTAGLVDAVRATGASVIWRCHVGLDEPNEHAWEAWAFLKPYVQEADAFVFSRAEYVWDGLNSGRAFVIRPSIDAFAPKNADQTPEQTAGILSHTGIVPGRTDEGTFIRADGTPWRVDHHSAIVEDRPLSHEDRVVAQVSRWDRLKDPLGVLSAFAEHIDEAHLVLAGPATESVADDPEGASVFAAVLDAWHELPASVRHRVHLVSLPMEDVEENAAIVNALQQHADVVVQKSLAEGFGLTVAEAMWKRRPVVASRVGGIQDQIVDGESGILIHPAGDLAQFGAAVAGILADRDRALAMGEAARLRVRDNFLGPFHLRQYFELIRRLISGEVPV